MDRWLAGILICSFAMFGVLIAYNTYSLAEARKDMAVTLQRLVTSEIRQDRLSQAYLRTDAAIDALSDRISNFEGRLIALSPADVAEIRKEIDELKKDLESR